MKIRIMAHCNDSFAYSVYEDGKRTAGFNGYVPSFLGGSDDVELEIDVETGQIIGWDAEAARAHINRGNEE